MAMKILSAREYSAKLKATIQATGRLGFSAETASYLGFESGKWAVFSYDDENDNSLYIGFKDNPTPDAFEIKVSSGYYYIATSQLFDALDIDYVNDTVMFDLVRKPALDDQLVGQVYLMKKRIIKRKEKSDTTRMDELF